MGESRHRLVHEEKLRPSHRRAREVELAQVDLNEVLGHRRAATGEADEFQRLLDHAFAVTADSSDKPLEVWDVNTAQCLTTLAGHAGAVKPPAISRDGNYVVAGGADATVRLWELDWDYQTQSG